MTEKEAESSIPFYAIGVRTHLQLKISKDRKSREEDVACIPDVIDEERGRNVGWKVLQRVFGGEKENGSDKS